MMRSFVVLFLFSMLFSNAAIANTCDTVWTSEFNENFSGEFNLLYDLNSSNNVYNFNNTNDFGLSTGTYVARRFRVRNSQIAFSGSGPVTIYADEVVIEGSIVNQYQPNPLIIIANDVTITGSQVNAALYIFDNSSSVQGSSITGGIASPNNLNITYGSGSTNNLYYNSFYFDDPGFGQECGDNTVTDHTFFDNFNFVSYANNHGEEDWAGPWVESNDGNPSAGSGNIRIENGQLLLHGPNRRISRSVDLSSYGSATLTFDYQSITNNYDDDVYLEAFVGTANGNANGQWDQLYLFDGNGPNSGSISIDLADYLSSNLQLRFRTDQYFDGGNVWYADYFYVDNFAIDAEPEVLTCPNTSAYTEIFTDNFSSDKGVYTTNNFTRSVSVWPGQSIVNDNQEDQNVDYVISNGRLNIEGAAGSNFEGNNEYGAVLHDLSTEFYEPENITEYSIEVDMLAPTGNDGYLNNDVGVVFGYEDDSNYYVIKWTKYGTRFANEATYPGTYKNLDLIKVSNGVATTLDSISNFNAAYPTRFKITVNADGISICIDGVGSLSASGEQPPLYKYGYFTYENEEGVSFDNLVVKCNGCMPVLQCPDTSSYDLIFNDNFNSTNNNNWQSHTLDRTQVSVWPNDTIYSDNQEQSVRYSVSNGLMNLAGRATGGLHNEFGVVIHDVNSEGYDKNQITTYSINTDFRSHSGQSNNNDAGVVFGYQNNSNFYVLKWTKYSFNYEFNTSFPGNYRDLEIIKVVNGVPTQLAVEPNFYAADDIELKITVNSDGITVCIEDENILHVPSEQPSLGQVGFFSYDNDYGVSFDNFQVWCQGCTTSSNIDHYRIIHPTQGLTCSTYDITVAACTDANCSSYSTETVTGNLRKVAGSSTVDILALNTSTGTQTTTFGHGSAETISFSLINQNPSPNSNNVCVANSVNGAVTNCEMEFADSGFVITAPDFVSASGWQEVEVKALKSDPNSPGSCAPAFSGVRPVTIGFAYDTPNSTNLASFVESPLLYNSTNSGNGFSISDSTVIAENLTFDAQAESSFYINYAEVGQLELIVYDTNGVLDTGRDDFVVYPDALSIGLSDADGNYLGAAGNLTHYADQTFNLVITAVNELDQITHNYQPGDLELAVTMLSPSISAGAHEVVFQYSDDDTLTVDNSSTWHSVQNELAPSFGLNGYSFDSSSFNNVGSFSVNIRDNNYLSTGRLIEIHTQGEVPITAGRFIPAYFDIVDVDEVVEEGNVALANTEGTFSYIGQNINFVEVPKFNYIAKTYKNLDATNYIFDMAAFDFDEENYVDVSTTTDGSGNVVSAPSQSEYPDLIVVQPAITVTDGSAFDAQIEFEMNAPFTYVKSAAPFNPITMALDLDFSIDDLRDADDVGYDSNGIDELVPAEASPNYESYGVNVVGAEARYGRLSLRDTSSGSLDSNLYVPLVIEYWNGDRYVTNTDDSSFDFSALEARLINSAGNEVSGFVLGSTGMIISNGTPANGEGIFVPAQSDGDYILELTTFPDWLNVNWDDSGSSADVINGDDWPSANIIFGSFSGNNRIIYKRER